MTEKGSGIINTSTRGEEGRSPRDNPVEEVGGYNSGVTTHTLETQSTVCARRSSGIRQMPKFW